ncbi:MAG: hypothetical protein MZV64_18925 [Ignavibacteriales bacterium]|nr:hypothetical protein [Ignavibacteriales bacterium]
MNRRAISISSGYILCVCVFRSMSRTFSDQPAIHFSCYRLQDAGKAL